MREKWATGDGVWRVETTIWLCRSYVKLYNGITIFLTIPYGEKQSETYVFFGYMICMYGTYVSTVLNILYDWHDRHDKHSSQSLSCCSCIFIVVPFAYLKSFYLHASISTTIPGMISAPRYVRCWVDHSCGSHTQHERHRWSDSCDWRICLWNGKIPEFVMST